MSKEPIFDDAVRIRPPSQLTLWKATIIAALVSPVIHPGSFLFLTHHEASWHPLYLGVAFIIYFYALKLTVPGALIFSAIAWYKYDALVEKPWWIWGILGGAIGCLFILLSQYIDPRVFGYRDARCLLFAIPSGGLTGFATGLIFRRIYIGKWIQKI